MLSSVACTEQDLVQRILHILNNDCTCVICDCKRCLYFSQQSADVALDEPTSRILGGNDTTDAVLRTETTQDAMKSMREGGQGPARPNYVGSKFATQAQTVLYADEARDAIYDVSTDTPPSMDKVVDMDIVNFLSRPVKLSTISWSGANGIGTDLLSGIQPYDTFLSNSRIANKVSNFAFIRATMKIKIVINSTPFNYGACRLVWQPGARSGTTNALRVPLAASSGNLMCFSQLPGVWLYPQNNQGVTLTIPYTNPYNWIDMRGATYNYWRARDMGQLNLIVYNTLQSANGTTPSVSISVYGWLENVELSAPSTALYNQSGDVRAKFKKTVRVAPHSDPVCDESVPPPPRQAWSEHLLSATSAIAPLEDVPVIGDYAKVASKVGKGIGKLVKALGFSDPTSITDVGPIKLQNVPVLSSGDISYPYQPLAVDYKNEVSVDPAICGIKTEDELSIRALTSKESFLTTIAIDQTVAAETVLATFNVAPSLKVYDSNIGTGYTNRFLHTPMSLISSLFDYWRGSIKLRFVVVASPFHKARIKIQHEPAPNNVNYYGTTGLEEVLQSAILDVGVDQDYTMTIPYQNYAAWLGSRNIDAQSNDFVVGSTAPANGVAPAAQDAYSPTLHNGQVYVRLLNVLSSPVAASTVYVNVFVSAGDDFEVACPTELPVTSSSGTLSLYVRQSGDMITEANKRSTMVGATESEVLAIPPQISAPQHVYDEYMGERVESMRQLLRRKTRYMSITTPTMVAGNFSNYTLQFNSVPLFPGVNPSGQSMIANLAATSNLNYNPAGLTYIALLKACFLGWRGSFNWLITDDLRNITALTAWKRSNYTIAASGKNPALTPFAVGTWLINTPASGGDRDMAQIVNTNNFSAPNFTSGGAFEPRETGAPLAITVPYYSYTKMLPCDDSVLSSTTTARRPSLVRVSGYIPASSVAQITTYVSAGIDFTLFYFQYVPILYTVGYNQPLV